ncbi:putative alanine aminotransferase, partial [Trypanosoma cruzi]
TALMCSPPRPGDASYESYWAEYNGIFASLKKRALLLAKELGTIRGFSCQPVEGAMYAFPTIELPEKYFQHNAELNAKEGRNLGPDTRWALELLESSGVVVVPGSGFGQRPNTLHFRTTILPPEQQMERMLKAMRTFQEGIWAKYG